MAPRYVALLRGVNVAGRRRVAMDELRASFDGAGYEHVVTHLQSGNVVFDAPRGRPDPASISTRLDADLGTPVAVLVRSADELARTVAANPFPENLGAPSTLLVTFVSEVPDPPAVAALAVPDGEDGRFVVRDREIYLSCPNGYGRTKLTNVFFERRLGVVATTRNWNTVCKLADLAGA